MPDHIAPRVKQLRQRFEKRQIDALLLTNPRDIRYLTGFIGEDSWAVVPSAGKIIILSDSRFDEEIDHTAPQCRKVLRKAALSDEVKKVVTSRDIGKLGVQAAYASTAQRKAIVKQIGAGRVRDVNDGLLLQRSIKDASEIKLIRKSLAIQQQAFLEMKQFIKPGMSENEVCAYLEFRMRTLGADGVSFPSIIAADANASLPHAIPGPRKLKRNGFVLVDWGARYAGYCSDLTRIVCMGRKLPKKIEEIYRVVLDAQMAAIDKIAPGVALADVDKAAREIIKKAGYGKQFSHGLGHGIGLDIHELPTLSGKATELLQPGQIVTVEPGIYLPGVGGVRIEDDILVTPRGHEVLSDLPKDLNSTKI